MDSGLMFSLRLSFQVAFVATAALTIVTVPCAYVFARYDFKGKQLVESAFNLPLVLPPTVLGYYLVVFFGRKGLIGAPVYDATGFTAMFTWWGAVIASFVVGFPLLFQTSANAIGSVDSKLEQTSYTLGKSRLATFREVTLPIAAKGIVAGMALAFARAMGEFGATLMLAGNIPGKTNTMPLAIYNLFASGRMHDANVLAIIYTIICFGALLVLGMLRKK